jgi:hypothetical protein
MYIQNILKVHWGDVGVQRLRGAGVLFHLRDLREQNCAQMPLMVDFHPAAG